MPAQLVLIIVALWSAWRPAETAALTPVLVALAALALVPWAHRRTAPPDLVRGCVAVLAVAVVAILSALGGEDRAAAAGELALAAAAAALAFMASREEPRERLQRLLALGLAALALWALYQVTVGFERAGEAVAALPDALQANAAERIASGRAFASLLLPGHLAALLATALPILAAAVRPSWRSAGWLSGALLCGVGLLLTRSPIGIGLALLAVGALAARRRRTLLVIGLLALAVALAAVIASRSDVAKLDPVRLRVDNWQTAVWVWRSSPLTGVGLGSYGQATRAVPLAVGNLPAHAHSLPLEWLAELGLAGLVAAGALAIALAGLLWRLWPRRPELAVALAVVPLHNLVDFSLYTSGVAIPWAVLLGWGVAATRPARPVVEGGRRRVPMVAASALAVAAALLHFTSVAVETAAGSAADSAQRVGGALEAQRLAPWRGSPPLLAAAAAIDLGDADRLAAAAGALERARWWRPRSASLAAAAGEVALARGFVPTAAADTWRAQAVQPRSGERRDAWVRLVSRLEAADDAAP
jgi:O-antigen ligase